MTSSLLTPALVHRFKTLAATTMDVEGSVMRLINLLPCAALIAITACDTSQPSANQSETPSAGNPVLPEVATSASPKSAVAEPSAVGGSGAVTKPGPYRLLGVLDPERNQMVAFALKVPADWQARQTMQRKWEGAVAMPQVSLTLRSPDGRSQIDYMPSVQYLYAEGPMTSNLRAQKQSLGLPTQMSANELAPMPATEYVKRILLPQLAQRGQSLSDVGNEKTAPEVREENGQRKLRGSVDGVLPNGNRARVEVRMTLSSRQLGTDLYYTWSVVPSITQTAGDLEVAHAHTVVAQDSIVPNPEWMKLEQETMARGLEANRQASAQQHQATMNQMRANSEAMNRAHEQRMSDIRAFGEANTARFNDRMSQMDRDQRIRVDTIRGETRYADPTTGERVKVEDGFNHVYRNQQNPNVYYGTDTPIDAGKVNWQELQKIQLRDY